MSRADSNDQVRIVHHEINDYINSDIIELEDRIYDLGFEAGQRSATPAIPIDVARVVQAVDRWGKILRENRALGIETDSAQIQVEDDLFSALRDLTPESRAAIAAALKDETQP